MKNKNINQKTDGISSSQVKQGNQKGDFYSWEVCCYMVEHISLSASETQKCKDFVSLCFKISNSAQKPIDEIAAKLQSLSHVNKKQKIRLHRSGILAQTDMICGEKDIVERCLDTCHELNARLCDLFISCTDSHIFRKMEKFIKRRVGLSQGFYYDELLDHLDLIPEILDPIMERLESLAKERQSSHSSAEFGRYLDVCGKTTHTK
jgi:hypothetical protein